MKRKLVLGITAGITVLAVVVGAFVLFTPRSQKLGDVENNDLSGVVEETCGIYVSDNGESYRWVEDVDKELLNRLVDVQISRKPISQDRGEERDRTNVVALLNEEDAYPATISYVNGVHICFSADFAEVWIDDGVKPTLSYYVQEPKVAKEIFEQILSVSVSDPGGGAGPDDIDSTEDFLRDGIYDEISFDIDGDGVVEICTLGVGPTSGLFSFRLSASPWDPTLSAPKYSEVYVLRCGYKLSFEVDNGKLRICGDKFGDGKELVYFDIAVKDGHILLQCEEEGMYFESDED